ncbi:ABC transporter permease [Leucobacter celer]|uniref:ABC transporter permease n=1 Tax=Leucobacter celer TaxID=668625 RepID=UPI0006A79FE4|nr:ABC transporter permease [Leucobacter celer]
MADTRLAVGPREDRVRARASRGPRRPWSIDLGRGRSLLILSPLLIVVAVFVVYPMAKLAIDSFTQGDGIGNYAQVLGSGATRKAFATTLWSSALVTLISVVLGGVLAWCIRATTSTLRRNIMLLAVLIPFCMGVVIKNYIFAVIFARTGVLNNVLLALGIIDEPAKIMYTPFAVVVGMVYAMLPYATLSMLAAFATIDLQLISAAKSMGASHARAVLGVVVPLGTAGLLASATIVFAISVGFYITPIVLGGTQTPFVASLIGDDLFELFNYPRAAATGVLLLLVALVVLLGGLKLVGGRALKAVLG